jgi:hypothetical protein
LESEGDFVNMEPLNDDDLDDSSVVHSNHDDGFRACDVDYGRYDNNSEVDEDKYEMAVKWRSDHVWWILVNDCSKNDPSFDDLRTFYTDILLGSGDYTRQDRPIISEEGMSQFNEEQWLAHNTILRAVLQPSNVMEKTAELAG